MRLRGTSHLLLAIVATISNDVTAFAPSLAAAPASPVGLGSRHAPVPVGLSGFPEDFVFGSAIAGFQVDMGCPSLPSAQCEDRNSDWYQWVTAHRIVHDPFLFVSGDPPTKGPGFRELFEGDLALAAGKSDLELATGAVRLSIEWSRIFPTSTVGVDGYDRLRLIASKENVDWYHRIFAAMKSRGLAPHVTVSHYSLPLWIHDGDSCHQDFDRCVRENKAGWGHPDRTRIVGEIAKYAGFIGREFGGEVDMWTTLNEPFSAVVLPGYVLASPMRASPPGLSGPWMNLRAAKTAAIAMIEAHARMYDALKASDTEDADGDGRPTEVGIVYPYSDIGPRTADARDAKAADDAHYFFEDMFMDGVVEGRLDETWNGQRVTRADLVNRCDFVGMNYYFGFDAEHFDLPLSWISPFLSFNILRGFDENRPRGIYAALMRLHRRYGKPIYVTETGTVQDDETRGAAWVVQTLSGVRRAIDDGAKVRGYFVWSLLDNYEWNQGASMKFGLYRVDPTTKARSAREAARVYGRIARERIVSPQVEAKYATVFPFR